MTQPYHEQSYRQLMCSENTSSADTLVSICIPTFNAARWIVECVNSALAQSYPSIEVLIVDDASVDNTVDLLQSIKDERLRIIVNSKNIGMVNNWNACIEQARGDLIKFLFHDDILYVDCLQKMTQLFEASEGLGLVFAARDVIVEGDTDAIMTKTWLRNCRTLHTKFGVIQPLNSGRKLFDQYVAGGFRGNWIGEPSSVLVRKDCFRRLGGFNPKLHQVCDIEMWLRIMFFYDIGFVPEKLSAFRFHTNSTSSANIKSRKNCLDQLWLVDSLMTEREIKLAHPEMEAIRGLELLRFIKAFLFAPVAITRCLRNGDAGWSIVPLFAKWAGRAIAYAVRKSLQTSGG